MIGNLVKEILVGAIILLISLFYGCVVVFSSCIKWLKVGKDFWVIKERKVPPACLNDPAYGTHGYIQLPDVKIHYVEKGDRSKPLLLLVHGFPEFWFTWRNNLKHFSKNYWVVALDLRGYGESEKPSQTSAYKMELLVRDIYSFVKAMKRDKCTLVGHDWGGAISWVVAATCPDIIEKLIILNAPHTGAYSKHLKTSPSQFLKSWYIFFFQLPYLPELLYPANDLAVIERLLGKCATKEELEAYKYNWSKKGALTPPINYYRNLLSPKAILQPKKLPIINTPTLVIWGEDDLALDKELATFPKEFVTNVKIKFVPEASHFVHNEKAEEVNQIIQEFIQS